jgi:predicted aconitase with swiveling domain
VGKRAVTEQALTGRALHPGEGTGEPLVLDAPLSFWGGKDEVGTIVDEHHPQRGARLTGRVVVMPTARGSSSSSSVLAEQIRTGAAPAALVFIDADAILMLGAWVAAELYGRQLPMVALAEPEYHALCRRGPSPVTVLAGPEQATISDAPAAPRPE